MAFGARLIALVRRELVDRRMLFPAALAFGLLPLLLRLLPTASSDPEGAMEMTCLLVSSVFLAGSAVILGSSIVVGEWAEDRMGFYLSKPLRPSEIWIGKLVAASVLGLGGTLLTLLPTVLAGGEPWRSLVADLVNRPPLVRLWVPRPWFDPQTFFFFRQDVQLVGSPVELAPWLPIAGFGIVLLGSHALAVLWRLRGLRTVFDLLVLLGVVSLLGSTLERNQQTGARALTVEGLLVLGMIGVVFLAGVGWLQLKLGGRMASRAHGVFTVALCLVLGGSALAFDLVSRRALHIELPDLEELTHLLPDEAGTWLFVGGPAPPRDTQRAFAIHRPSGRAVDLGALDRLLHAPTASADGRRLAWYRLPETTKGTLRVFALDLRTLPGELSADDGGPPGRLLDTPEPLELPMPIESHLPMGRLPSLALDAGGEHIAVWVGDLVRLHAFDDGRLLGSWALAKGSYRPLLHFAADGSLRAIRSEPRQRPTEEGMGTEFHTTILELRPGNAAVPLCRFEGVVELYEPGPNRILVSRPDAHPRVLDTDCRVLAEIANPRTPRLKRFLRDGSLLFAYTESAHFPELYRLEIEEPPTDSESARLGPNGSATAPIPPLSETFLLPEAGSFVFLGVETGDGGLWFGLRSRLDDMSRVSGDGDFEGHFDASFLDLDRWTALELDLETGEVRRRFPGFVPLPYSVNLRLDLPPSDPPAWLLDVRGRPHHLPAGASQPQPVPEGPW